MRSKRLNNNSDCEVSLDIPSNAIYNTSSDCIIQTDDYDRTCKCCEFFKEYAKEISSNLFRKKTLYKILPILTWLPKYNRNDFLGDIIAGITVGLTVIPQGLAYAGIAGLDLQYGLYSCFMGCFIYIFLGSSKDVPVGPTAISALLTFQTTHGVWQKAVLLTFLTGLVEICMGIFRLGFLIDFVSGPVSAGFTSAGSLIIFTSQLKGLLGLNTDGDTFVEMWVSIISDLHNISWNDAGLGILCIIVLLIMRAMASTRFGQENGKTWPQKFFSALFWIVGTSRNAVLVILSAIIGYFLVQTNRQTFRMIGEIPSGLPKVQFPPLSMYTLKNNTLGEVEKVYEDFPHMVSSLGYGIIVVPLISLLENMAVVQTFANGRPCDATQELIALGVCNVANSFVQGFRGNGGIARGAVLNSSGARTQLSNLYTGIIVIIALMYLTPAFHYVPKATLAAIIMAAVIFMVQYRVIKPMWRSKKSDLIPGLATFVACLILPLQLGVLVGIGINILFILYHAARPKLRVETLTSSKGLKYLMLTPDRCLIFPSVEFVRNVITKHGRKSTLPVVIDCTHIYGADFTAAKVISTMINDFEACQQKIYFFNLQTRVAQVFEGLHRGLNVLYDMDSLEMALSSNEYREGNQRNV